MPVPQLPAGRYVMRAIIADHEQPLTTMTRSFEVAPPAVLMTSAEGTGSSSSSSSSVDAELFLPVGDELLVAAVSPRPRRGGRHVEAVPRSRAAVRVGTRSIRAWR